MKYSSDHIESSLPGESAARFPSQVFDFLCLAALWTLLTLGLAPEARAQALIGGSTSCTALGGTDVVFLIDNSGSISASAYATYASTVQSIAASLRAANPSTRLAVAHYAGPASGSTFGQNIYFERDFSTAAMSTPQRQFGPGGAHNSTLIMDNLAGAVLQMSYGLDANVGTTSSFILGSLKELNRDLTRPLQIVAFTDGGRDTYNDSAIIDGTGYASSLKDGSSFTVYNRLKAQGVKFSMATFYPSAYPIGEQAAAAIASVGGSWTGSVEANAADPEGSGTKPRRVESTPGFTMDSAKILNFVTPVANVCPAATVDYGDAPSSYGAPGHVFAPGGPRLGPNGPDAEPAPHHSAGATGDDVNGTDDEDGIVFGTPQVGQSVMMTARVPLGYPSGYFNAWIDWNRDGDFLDAGEHVAIDRRDDGTVHDYGFNDFSIQFLVNVPATALAGQSYMARFRLSTQAGLAANSGIAPDGEIEDHAFVVNAYTPPGGAPVGACAGPSLLTNGDFANSSNWAVSYNTATPSGGYAVGEAGTNSPLATPPTYRNNAGGVFRSFVDTVGNLGGVSGLHLRNESTVSIVNGQTYVFSYDFQRIVNSASVGAALEWVLVNASTNAIVQIIPNSAVQLTGSPTVWTQYASSFVATAPTGSYKLAMTFRPTSVSTQVIDYYLDRVYFAPFYSCDFGDAPASYGAPMHLITGALKLGSVAPDSEGAHQPSATARGDDETGVDDEDGVSAFPELFSGQTSYSLPRVNVSATGTGTLRAWIDFDKNGVFTANEHATVAVTAGVLAGPLNWTGIVIGGAGGSFARLRFTSTALTDLTTTSALDERSIDPAFDGEVEDYAVTIHPAASLPPAASLAVCHQPAAPSLTNAVGVLWRHNTPPGSLDGEILAQGLQLSEISSAAPLVPGAGLTYTHPSPSFTAYHVSGASLSSAAMAYSAHDYISYSFTTSAAMSPGLYLRNFILHRPSNSYPTLFPFKTTILLSTDPNFSSAMVLTNAWELQQLSTDDYPLRAAAAVMLAPSTTYYIRAIVYDVASASGSGFWDDFGLLMGMCADLSDAPVSYGEAAHMGDASMRLGATRSLDPLPIASLDAMGDGATDDGVFFGAVGGGLGLQGRSFTQGVPQTLEISVTGAGGRLSGWFDWNRDGAFSGPEERPIVNLMDNGPGDLNLAVGVIRVSITPPALVGGVGFARFRWSSMAVLGASGAASNGEVEDYAIELVSQDRLAFALSPNNESALEPGQIAIYGHRLLIGESLGGGSVAFQIVSDRGLAWRLFRDDGDGVYGAGDALWPAGGAALPAGSHGFWLVAQIPAETPAEWRDLTRLTASILRGQISRNSAVQDLTRVGDAESGRLMARKLQALDANCDGAPDAGEAGFSTQDQSIPLGGCAIYRVVFENAGAARITRVRVHDHTPDWTIYRSGSGQALTYPAGLTPLTPTLPGADQEGAVLFPFDGFLQPGERGIVQFGVKLPGGSGGSGGGPPN